MPSDHRTAPLRSQLPESVTSRARADRMCSLSPSPSTGIVLCPAAPCPGGLVVPTNEASVQILRTVSSHALTDEDVAVLREGYESERQIVLGKIAKIQRLSLSVPQQIVNGCCAEPLRIHHIVAEWIRPCVFLASYSPAPAQVAPDQPSAPPPSAGVPPPKGGARTPDPIGSFEWIASPAEAVPEQRGALSSSAPIPPAAAPLAGARAHPCRVILYFHGGSYITGGINSHRRLMSQLAVAAGVPVLGVNYRRMPLHTFDEVLQDAALAFHHLSEELRYPAKDIAIAGDAAGAHLAISLVLHRKERSQELPGAIVGLSPWIDPLGCSPTSVESWMKHSEYDPLACSASLVNVARMCIQNHKYASLLPHSAGAPGLLGNGRSLAWFPRCLLQVGSLECLAGPTEEFARHLKVWGASVQLEVFRDQIHCFHMFERASGEAQRAIATAGAFLKAVEADVKQPNELDAIRTNTKE
eukprot:CAMPEP_0117697958 /NCGR_PEP_ID=MMETSP0804-20121206/29513_1 /TAXON_ID=1074897 /ORGANISM="Tetraselmis astigmatica, Strain CCMP880" /LENGTH=469 /DNA_ID=CAMNT_0005512257 /DNA_START=194 /DNA_END=1604 /DNA_ORIENTATION=+